MDFDIFLAHAHRAVAKIHSELPPNYDISAAIIPLQDIVSNARDVKKVVYYLILNSNHSITDDLLDDATVGLLIDTSATLDLTFVVKMLIASGYQDILLEIITHSAIGLTTPIVELLIQDDKDDVATKMKLANAIYKKMVSSDSPTDKFKSFFHDTVSRASSCFIDAIEHNNLEFAGVCFFEFSAMMYNCVEGYRNRCELDELYCLEREYVNDEKLDKSLVKSLLNDIIVSNLKAIMNYLSCDTWISWLEITQPRTNLPMQTAIGNMLYRIFNHISITQWKLPENFLANVAIFQIKPLTLDDIIGRSSIEEITVAIESDLDASIKTKWYKHFSESKDAWLDESRIMRITEYIHLAENASEIIDMCCDYLIKQDDSNRALKLSLLSKLKEEPFAHQVETMNSIFERRFDLFYNVETDADIIHIFNKISKDDDAKEVASSIVIYILQNPHCVLSKIIQFAFLSMDNQELSCSLLVLLNKASTLKSFPTDEGYVTDTNVLQYIFEDILESEVITDKWSRLFVSFIKMLHDHHLLPVKFLKEVLLERLWESIERKEWIKANCLAKSFCSIWSSCSNEFDLYALSAFIALAITSTSWSMTTFSSQKMLLNKILVDIARDVMSKEMPCDAAGRLYASDLIAQLPIQVGIHFARIIPDDLELMIRRSEWHVKMLFHCCSHFNFQEYLNLSHEILESNSTKAFVKILPFIHLEDWKKLNQLLCDIFELKRSAATKCFARALYIQASCLLPEEAACFEYCFNNYFIIFEANLKDAEMPDSEIFDALGLLVRPLNRLDVQTVRDKCYLKLIPFIVKLLKPCSPVSKKCIKFMHEDWKETLLNAMSMGSVGTKNEEELNAVEDHVVVEEENDFVVLES